jgi:hypothetical protein
VGIAIGVPGSAADLQRPLQVPRLPHPGGEVDQRDLLEVLAVGVSDFGCVAEHRCAMGFREPDRRAEVVDVGVRQQECMDVVDVIAELTDGGQHVVSLAGKARVDDQQAGVVGDEGPIHQVGLGKVDGVGELCQLD